MIRGQEPFLGIDNINKNVKGRRRPREASLGAVFAVAEGADHRDNRLDGPCGKG